MKKLSSTARNTLFVIVLPLLMFALSPSVHASTAYGTLNNFDCVNDTGVEAHGFEIELNDVHSKDITYTYDYNHYGIPKISEDNTDLLHPKVFIRYAATRMPGGTWTAYTAIPAGAITPTDGHQFTNPSVNFGGEHFGVGYYGAPTAVKYNWLIDDGTGNLVHGPPVYIATPTFTYYPPAPLQPPQVQAVIVPPPPPAPPVLQFGKATWVKDIKTTTHNTNKVELVQLVDPDPDNPAAKNWANGEPAEIETEWRILQTEFANAGNPKGELRGQPQDLPGGDEVVTRRYEFYKYTGPIDAESGEAMADIVAADGIHGAGTVTYNDHIDPKTGEWVTVTVDLSTIVVVGDFFGAQMSGFDVAPVLGLIDHIPDGELNVPYAERTVVVSEADTPFHATTSGSLPDGTILDEFTGIFSGTPTVAGVFTFTVDAKNLFTDAVLASKTYTVTIPGDAPAASTIATSASPVAGGSTTGDGVYENGTHLTVVATHNASYAFVNWTESGVEVSASAVYPFTVSANRTLAANFVHSPLLNPGFEAGTASPWTFYTDAAGSFDIDRPGNGSPHAGHVTVAQAGSNVQLYQQDITLKPNTTYQLKFTAYSKTGNDLSVSLFKHGPPFTSYGLSDYLCDLTTTWSTFSVEFTTSGFSETVNDARLMFWLAPFAAAGEEYFIDDVILEEVLSNSILKNPRFEAIAPSPWKFYTDTAGSFDADRPGNGSPRAGHVAVGLAGSNVQLYHPDINLEPNTSYQLIFDAYSRTGNDLSVSLFKHGPPFTSYGLSDYLCDLTTTWSTFSVEFTTSGFSETVNDARLIFWLAPFANPGNEYFFDNVMLVKK